MFTVRNQVAKVMFLHVSVILLTGGGCLPKCMLGYTPRWRQTPPSPGIRHPQKQIPPEADPPPETATAADGMHPTGMHSCYNVTMGPISEQILCLNRELNLSLSQLQNTCHCGRVVSAYACQAGGLWFKSGILPLLKHASFWKATGCYAGYIHWQRCRTRGESQGTYITYTSTKFE